MTVELTQERLRYLLHYDPETGVFRWRVSPCWHVPVGHVCGPGRSGYVVVMIKGSNYNASNLAWLYMTGEWPQEGIDHKDGNPLNDRWENLRLANQSQNSANRRIASNNTSGFKGVSWSKTNQKWFAYVYVNGQRIGCGHFDDPEEAARVRNAKATLLHGEFARFDSIPKGTLQ